MEEIKHFIKVPDALRSIFKENVLISWDVFTVAEFGQSEVKDPVTDVKTFVDHP